MPEARPRSPSRKQRPQFAAAALMRRFVADDGGATAIEYAVVAAGIGVTVATAVYALGNVVSANLYDRLATMF